MPNADFFRDAADAEMILIGIGNEFEEDFTSKEREVVEQLEDSEYAWLIPAYRDFLGAQKEENRVRTALEKLLQVIDGKNYFVISQAQNGILPQMNWREGRLVMPCGGAFRKQCSQNCNCGSEKEAETCLTLSKEEQEAIRSVCGNLEDWICGAAEENDRGAEEKARETEREKPEEQSEGSERSEEADFPPEVLRALRLIDKKEQGDPTTPILRKKIAKNLLGICPDCGAEMILNTVYASKYDEKGYLKDWQRYTKWLQGSVNRKVLVVELGVGMEYAGMIRIPFERITFLNQKAKMYRIHQDLFQISDKLREKGVGISENAIDWLANL